ncbi:MAG: HAMP domain-containing protein, partial [Planctomycetota bacterium]|nr:HAMP domain-containing protein [Planctomycetota bacterium]
MHGAPSTRGSTTLARRLAYKTTALVVGVALLAGAMLWGLYGLRRDYQAALAQYNQLRRVYETGLAIAAVRDSLDLAPTDHERATQRVAAALGRLTDFGPPPVPGTEPVVDAAARVEAELHAALIELRGEGDTRQAEASVRNALGEIARLAQQVRQEIRQIDLDSAARLRTTMLVMGVSSLLMIFGAVFVEAWQYRRVMSPLRQLGEGVRDLAAGRLERRLPPGGDAEFVRLAQDFNHMAAELDGLYRQLERRVAEKSRELVRSERLASVGFLAAGVAHEINNPLAIMTGHAELALRGIERSGASADATSNPTGQATGQAMGQTTSQ